MAGNDRARKQNDRTLQESDFKREATNANAFGGRFTSLYDADSARDEDSYSRGDRSRRRTYDRSSQRTTRSSRYEQSGSSRSESRNDYRRYEEEDEYERSGRGNTSREYNGRPQWMGARINWREKTQQVITHATGASTRDAFTLPQVRNEANFALIASTILLLVIGLIMVASSSYYYAYTTTSDSLYFFRRQLIWVIISLVAMVVVSRLPLKLIRSLSLAAYLFSILCSILVLFFGQEANGSTRWLGVGSLSFQPAELAKLAIAMFMARQVEDNYNRMGEGKVFLALLIVVGIPTGLVAYQNLSSGIIIAFVGCVIMFVGGAKIKHFLVIVLPAFALVSLLVILPMLTDVSEMNGPLGSFLQDFTYRSDRVSAWLNPFADSMGDGYQTVQALYAVGSGGLFGRGLGQSIQKLGYIPFAYNDIIFAVICEELGLFGAGLVLVLFGIFTWNGVKISLKAPNTYTALLAIGLVSQIGIQAVLNVAVNTNSVPATGISLPFISYGGSSMLFLMASVGLIINISTYTQRTEKQEMRAAAREAKKQKRNLSDASES